VTQARRQAGSAFKPIVFASAGSSGIPITTPLLGPGAADYDERLPPRRPRLDDREPRDCARRCASSNRAAVVLGERVGCSERDPDLALALGLSTPIHPYPSTFLGASEVVPIELVAAFSAFANGGYRMTPRLVKRVEDSRGRLLWEPPVQRRRRSPGGRLPRDQPDAGRRQPRHREPGAAGGAPVRVPAAGKTGTTNEAADAWFIGFTPDVSAGVWFGFDRPRGSCMAAVGGSLAAPVWGRVMAEHYRTHAPRALVAAGAAHVDRETGLLATSNCPEEHVVAEHFIHGTEPGEYCHLHPEGIEGWFRRTVRGFGDWIGGRRSN
jgi:penicillin-binding protein 2D